MFLETSGNWSTGAVCDDSSSIRGPWVRGGRGSKGRGNGDSGGSRGTFDPVDEGRGGGHGMNDGGGMWGQVSYSGGVSFIKFCEELIGVDVRRRFPAVMCFGESFPPDKVLQLLPVSSDLEYLFHFPFWLSIDKVWSGFLVFVAV